MYALDMNTVLDYFKGKGNVGAKLDAVPPGEVTLPAVGAYEVWVGMLGSPNAKRRLAEYERFLSVIDILPFDAAAGRRAADLRVALERKGEAIGPTDTLIAATALAHGATLVTRNVREFGRVPGLSCGELARGVSGCARERARRSVSQRRPRRLPPSSTRARRDLCREIGSRRALRCWRRAIPS